MGQTVLKREAKREYGALVKRSKPREDIPFADGFPARLIREGLPGRLKRENDKIWLPMQQPIQRHPKKKAPQKALPRRQLDQRDVKVLSLQNSTTTQFPEIFPPEDVGTVIHQEPRSMLTVNDVQKDVALGSGAQETSGNSSELASPDQESSKREEEMSSQKAFRETEYTGPAKAGTNLTTVQPVRDAEFSTGVGSQVEEENRVSAVQIEQGQLGEAIIEEIQEENINPTVHIEEQLGEAVREETITQSSIEVATQPCNSTTVCVLGLDRIGKYIAHSLAAQPFPPSVNLLIHRPYLMKKWFEEGAAIGVWRDGKLDVQSGFNVELTESYVFKDYEKLVGGRPVSRRIDPPSTIIDNLMVTTDAHATIPALRSLSHRLSASSTICFMRDGIGLIDEVNSRVFPDPATRPKYTMAKLSHHIYQTEKSFTIMEKGSGELICTNTPRESKPDSEDGNEKETTTQRKKKAWGIIQYSRMMRFLTKAPNLNARSLNRQMFFEEVMDRTIFNSVIGPLTVMFDCSNDQLLFNHSIREIKHQLLAEISTIISRMPEFSRQETQRSFQSFALQKRLYHVILKTGTNKSDMLKAVRRGTKAGVEYYNGYFIRRAEELGVPCPLNQMLLSLVQAKQHIISREQNAYVPFDELNSRRALGEKQGFVHRPDLEFES
ncbi:hypothetical protein HYFRA_00010596 [Hymenoscyphus fraxineus]|uniref:2-dehydropantoate 2-reductase n=1 Tax=Hymenoscyphus fraxineus TaxID=746836 RepID=A0A9N9LAV3_9HELO|nr:hypothetical protein HYFRA_00010596 [Hymenoscyphus fraxineus]